MLKAMNFLASSGFLPPAISAMLAGTTEVMLGYTKSTGKPEYLPARPKKSITMPMP